MRVSNVAFFAAAAGAGCIALWLMFAWRQQPSSVVKASITLVSYTDFTMPNPDTNVFVYPGRGHWLRAQMKLKNEGKATISYGAWGDEPYGWANAQTCKGLTNGYLSIYLAPHFTGGTAVLYPGSNAMFWVFLPMDTVRWQCGFSVDRKSSGS